MSEIYTLNLPKCGTRRKDRPRGRTSGGMWPKVCLCLYITKKKKPINCMPTLKKEKKKTL